MADFTSVTNIILLLILFLLGSCVGSFLGVLIDRLPRSESIWKGRSHCESCHKTLSALDLIPIISFIFLKGRCRYCKEKQSYLYPIIEFVTGFLFVGSYIYLLNNSQFQSLDIRFLIELAYYLVISSSLLVIFFTDLKTGIIPDKIVIPALSASIIFHLLFARAEFMNHFISGLGAFLFFLFLFVITRGRGMGFGDVKLSALLGFLAGFPGVIAGLYLAFLTGGIAGIILVLWGKKKFRRDTIPFGPFLIFGLLITFFFGDKLMQKALIFLNF